ncbi:hypothetical protein PRCB_02680 [Pantoea rodasii]|uniref:Multidrug resistance-like ATP-binding protein MdlB n=1 Tax=Pantoea rodasii TaxID=1076549 RepID=A0A2M9WHC4_9GAMM|nr:ATP-binding cassette domain-containing protein [Pantoea rodasii]PJZ06937.1 hypothetical protein PRCB_02680 [Pantoea rodasii]
MKSPSKLLTAQILPALSLNLLSGILITASYLLQALLFTQLIIGLNASTSNTLMMLIVMLAGNALLRAVLIGFRAMQTEQLAANVRTRLRQQLFRPLLTPGFDVMQHHSATKLQVTLGEGVEVMEGFYSRYLPALLLALLSGAATVITLASFDLFSGAILLLFMVACPVLDHLFMRQQRQHIVGVFAAMQRFAEDLMDALRGMLTLKACNAVPRFREKMAGHAASLRHESMKTLRVTMMRGGITRFISLLGTCGLLIINAWRTMQGAVDPALLLLTLFITWEAFRPILQLETVFHTLWAAQEMRPAIQEMAASTATVHDPDFPHPMPAGHTLRLEAITYRWPGQPKALFNNLTLTIAENRHTAFIGPSGSGKSTLFQLITRFIAPESGAIFLGDEPISELSIAAFRRRVSWVSQQVFLIDGTLAENLRLGRPDATEAAIWQALQQAQLAEWVQTLPQRLNTLVGENGGLLSGGQRQRLAIARALLKQSPILILDEITSNLDVVNEAAIQRVISSLSGHCTLISIAHRLNTIAQADHIVVLQDGDIIEQGSPASLRLENGYYASLLQSQETTH